MKQFIKNFNNLIKKTIFKVQNKTNNKLLLFKAQNKTNNKLLISKFNKYLITLISLLFFYLFYLSIPVLYNKNWVQKNIEHQLLKDFKIYFSLSSDISYRILPSPHYLIKDSKIIKKDDKTIALAKIKSLKVFVSQKNFFLHKKKLTIKHIKIKNADFIFLENDLRLLKKNANNKFSNKKIEINKSNVFFKNNLDEIISIIKIPHAFLLYDKENLLNLFDLEGKIFDIPFNLNYNKKFNSKDSEKININAQTLRLNIFNMYASEKNNAGSGKNIISFLNSKIDTNYKIENNTIVFKSNDSKINNSKVSYNGDLSINPFDLNLNINIDNYKISRFFDPNSILNSLIKTNLLFNKNISMSSLITTNQKSKNKFFQNAEIQFNIIDGKLNLNKTRLINEKIGLLELKNSNLSFENNKLILNTDILVDIKNSDKLFSLLQTNKKVRKPIKDILINLDYDFSSDEIQFNNIQIDNKKISNELLRIIEEFNDNKLNNWNRSKRLLNVFFTAYEG